MNVRVKSFLGEKMKSTYIKYAFGLLLLPLSITVFAQEDASKMSDVEEVVVVGSQIKGAKITGALPVSIISSRDIEAIGVDSGRAPVIFAPLICDPTTTTSSTSLIFEASS